MSSRSSALTSPLHRRDLVFVVDIEDLLLELEPRSAYDRLAYCVRVFLEQSRSDLLADALAGGVSVFSVRYVCMWPLAP